MRVPVFIYHLEMTDPAQLIPATRPLGTPFTLMQAEIPCPELNRFLYTAVGKDYHWTDRLKWSEADWRSYLKSGNVETWVAYVSGTPAGYFELEKQPEGNVEIVYFGLLPQFTGQGLGGALLTTAVQRAWALGAKRVWVHTCSLDHPNALSCYKARGFRLFKIASGEQETGIPEIKP